MPFFAVSYNLEVQVKAANAPQVSAVGVVSCALTNVLLDYLFVMRFGWGVDVYKRQIYQRDGCGAA